MIKHAMKALFRSGRSGRGLQPVHEITLYGRPGCHLCEDARALLDRLGRRYLMRVNEVDITQDAELVRAYDLVIPVVVIGGVELTAPIREADVIRVLEASGRG